MRSLSIVVLLFVSVACVGDKKSAWRESGASWRASGRSFLNALGNTIKGDPEKREWKAVGENFGEAGKDTADAVGTSIQPEGGSSASRRDSEPEKADSRY